MTMRLGRTLSFSLLAWLARLYPWSVESSDTLDEAIRFLDWDVQPAAIVRAGYGGGMFVAVALTCLLFFVTAAVRLSSLLVVSIATLSTVHGIHTIPTVCARARKTSALGAAPDLVSRAVLRMRLSPAPERAASFAAQSGNGALADSLAAHIRQTQHSAQSGLAAFGDAWADSFPALRRAFALVTVAGRTPESDRDRLLDRALTVVLDGTAEQMQSFAAQIRAPVTALYAFGVLLPTALVALLPAAGVAGIGVTPVAVVTVYNLVLPAILVVTSLWLLANRPVAFPPPNVTATHPDVPDRTRHAVLAGFGAGAICWFLTARVFPWWGPPIGAVGIGAGFGLVVATRPVISVYEQIRQVEAMLPDALELLGRRVANGRAVESAVDRVAGELDGPMGELLAAGAKQQRQLQIGVDEAFLGEYGVLRSIPSPRVRGSFALLGLAAREGRPAGTALLSLAEHVEELQDIERESRHSLAHVCRTLRSTGMVFGPLVAGATVALAGGISGDTALPGGEQTLSWIGGPVGAYVLLLAVLLTALSTGLTRGFDRSLVSYRVGRALISATSAYLCSYLLVGAVM